MSMFEVVAILTSLTAIFGYANYRYVRLPPSIGLMALGLIGSLVLLALGRGGVIDPARLTVFVTVIDFDTTLLHGVLGALLFAGALHVDLAQLRRQRALIAALSTAGVVLSTILVGGGVYWLTMALGIPVPLPWCLVFGALISPTDPIAVGAILRKAGVPKSLEVTITGESLFNDGIGVVVFLVLVGIASGSEQLSVGHVTELFLIEVVGGTIFGLVLGWLTTRLLKRVDEYQVEIMLTLAVTTGGFALANRLHFSGALAMVVAGLMIGNSGRQLAMSAITQTRLDDFWELIDAFLNAMLFVLIGVEVVVIEFTGASGLAGVLAIPLVLLARFVSAGIPLSLLARRATSSMRGALPILTWSGLRGGISIALALSLPASGSRATMITMTYIVVCFSILVQGLTVSSLVARVLGRESQTAGAA